LERNNKILKFIKMGYIVRLMGENEQYEISKEMLDEMNIHDNKIVEYTKEAKALEEKIREEIEEMQKIARKGKPVNFKKSDFVIPQKDITLDEAIEMFEGEGIIKG